MPNFTPLKSLVGIVSRNYDATRRKIHRHKILTIMHTTDVGRELLVNIDSLLAEGLIKDEDIYKIHGIKLSERPNITIRIGNKLIESSVLLKQSEQIVITVGKIKLSMVVSETLPGEQ